MTESVSFNIDEKAIGKIIGKLNVIDPDDNQSNVKYKLTNSDDRDHFKITRSGDISFLRFIFKSYLIKLIKS